MKELPTAETSTGDQASAGSAAGSKDTDLETLFRRMRSSDAAEVDSAWGDCYRLYSSKVWSRVFYVLSTIPWLKEPKEVAIDVTSEVFARLPQTLKRYQETGKAEPWLMRVAVRAALRQKESITGVWSKKGSRRIAVELSEESVSRIENELEIEQQDARLELARRMEEWERDPARASWIKFVSLFLEGYGHEDIAQQLGISVGTSRTMLWKIRCELGRTTTTRENSR
jgi:RNA polymerase sigma factor (sigma-70 family)